MSDHGLTKENFLGSLPISLSGDPKMVALAGTIAGVLEQHRKEIECVSIYPHIDRLDEALLDILAYDFKVDWWDADYSLEEKRRTLQSSWQVHKTLGTKAAVEGALRAIFPQSSVEPWFRYESGKPYHFRLEINLTGEKYKEGKLSRVLGTVQYYKSLRDHLDAIQYTVKLPPSTLHVGGGAGQNTSLGVPAGKDQYAFRHTLYAGGTYAPQVFQPVPENTGQPPTATILRTGGVCTILSNL